MGIKGKVGKTGRKRRKYPHSKKLPTGNLADAAKRIIEYEEKKSPLLRTIR